MLEQEMPSPYYTVDTLEPGRSVGFLIKRCGVLMTQIAERAFAAQPISFTQWIVLMNLTERACASPTELSAHMGHDMGALTRVVDELERDGQVRRERSQHDRRAVEIAITAEGRRVANVGKRVVVDLLNQLVEPYSEAEVEALISLLQRFLTRMQTLEGTAPLVDIPSMAAKARGTRGTTRTSAKETRTTRATPRKKRTD
jgi:DNA-binding MarR family transcriptional regulator